ncbi:MAG: aminotransferase class III-fold pyridoxal phosphate-dependent enzyme, partial [Gemmatimonadetes bacterium]|nr:aminotransferase class III-fold pyridoxal phosphate-dependent enzyme [Gemmatimonadota bacterium]
MAADEERTDWATRLSRVESRNVTFLRPPPPFWTEASGAHVRDAGGNIYLDFTGAFGVAFAGHRHPMVVERIRQQADRLIHGMGDIQPPAVKVEFLEQLAALMPWPESRTILGLSGSDAVEAALKTAQLATGRTGVIAFEGSYHGLTLGALATTHREHFRRPFTDRLADHVHYLPFPSSPDGAEQVLERVSSLLSSPVSVPVGAVIVEPIQGRAGVRIPPDDFLAGLAERT